MPTELAMPSLDDIFRQVYTDSIINDVRYMYYDQYTGQVKYKVFDETHFVEFRKPKNYKGKMQGSNI